MLRLAFDFIITWRETRTRPNAYLHLSEAAVSPVWQWLFTKVSRQLHVSENPDSSGRRYGFFRPLAKILP